MEMTRKLEGRKTRVPNAASKEETREEQKCRANCR